MRRTLAAIILCGLGLLVGCSGSDSEKPQDPGTDSDVLAWSFEGSAAGWTASHWQVSQEKSYLGSAALRTESYESQERHCGKDFFFYPFCDLTLDHGVDLSDCSDATLEYWQILQYVSNGGAFQEYPPCQWEGPNFDAWVEVSLNGGSWQRVLTNGHSHVNPQWEKVTVSLSAFVGPGSRDVRLRFRFRGGATLAIDQCWWFLDAVEIRKAP